MTRSEGNDSTNEVCLSKLMCSMWNATPCWTAATTCRSVFPYPELNRMQSVVFDTVFNTGEDCLVC